MDILGKGTYTGRDLIRQRDTMDISGKGTLVMI